MSEMPVSRSTVLSDFLGPQRRAALLRRATIYGGFAVAWAVAFLVGLVRWLSDELDGDGISLVEGLLELPGSVLLAGLIGLVPWAMRRGARREATSRLEVVGTRLVIQDVYDRREVDLATARCQVKLSGGHHSPYRPVLEAYRADDDIWPLVVELADTETRLVRSPEDMLVLAAALEQSDRRESWDAAGRLRTLATWKSLPVIFGADPDAIPITPAGERSANPTPVSAGEAAPEIVLPPRQPIRPLPRAAGDLLLALGAWALVLSSLTVYNATHVDNFDKAFRTGSARVTECYRYGPISRSGFGYWYQCRAEVTWTDGTRRVVTTRGSALTPADVDRSVKVREIPPGRRAGGWHTERADHQPKVWGAVIFFLLFGVGSLCALRPAIDLVRLIRWLVRLVRRRTGAADLIRLGPARR
jgi:Family of unknown function (DUF6346)